MTARWRWRAQGSRAKAERLQSANGPALAHLQPRNRRRPPADNAGMRHKPPHRRTLDNLTTFTVTLTAAELIRWHRLAKKDSLTFEQLAKRSVERAIADD